jgi:hypothetical protein
MGMGLAVYCARSVRHSQFTSKSLPRSSCTAYWTALSTGFPIPAQSWLWTGRPVGASCAPQTTQDQQPVRSQSPQTHEPSTPGPPQPSYIAPQAAPDQLRRYKLEWCNSGASVRGRGQHGLSFGCSRGSCGPPCDLRPCVQGPAPRRTWVPAQLQGSDALLALPGAAVGGLLHRLRHRSLQRAQAEHACTAAAGGITRCPLKRTCGPVEIDTTDARNVNGPMCTSFATPLHCRDVW